MLAEANTDFMKAKVAVFIKFYKFELHKNCHLQIICPASICHLNIEQFFRIHQPIFKRLRNFPKILNWGNFMVFVLQNFSENRLFHEIMTTDF